MSNGVTIDACQTWTIGHYNKSNTEFIPGPILLGLCISRRTCGRDNEHTGARAHKSTFGMKGYSNVDVAEQKFGFEERFT